MHPLHELFHTGQIFVIIERPVDTARMRRIPENARQNEQPHTALCDAFVKINDAIRHEIIVVPVHGGLGRLDHAIFKDQRVCQLER